MKVRTSKPVRLIFSGIFLTITLALVYNNAFFTHTHKLPDGTIVQHAHPYQNNSDSQSPFKTHHHTSFEFLLLDNLGVFLVVAGLVFLLFESCLLDSKTDQYSLKLCSSHYLYHFYRGPPQIS